MDHRENDTTGTAGLPAQQEQNRQAFLRYLPRRIADFERRILRYRFAEWDPNGMVVLAGDVRRLAEAASTYSLVETHDHLLALAGMVGSHVSGLRVPDPKQAERMFALLSAVLRSLPSTPQPLSPPTAAADTDAPAVVAPAVVADAATADPTEAATATVAGEDAAVAEPEAREPEPVAVEPARSAESTPVPANDAVDATTAEAVFAETPAESVASHEVVDAAGFPEDSESAPEASPVAPQPSPPSASRDAFDQPPADEVDRGGGGDSQADEKVPAPASPVEPTESEQQPADRRPAALEAGAEAGSAPMGAGQPPRVPANPESFDDAEEPEAVGSVGMRRIFHLSDGNAFAAELGQRLESDGYAVETVENVDELSELLTCLMPHMLLVDASQASRLAIIGALRRDAQQQSQPPRHIQMIVMAEHDGMDVRRSAYRAGADLLLFPPFDVAGVSRRLKALHASAAVEPVRVLVVDDERADALFAQAVLNRAGMHARVEHDPMRVIEALAAERADLILMDLHMPFANGVEVTMLLRDDPQFARIPIVFLSGESDPDSRLEAINAGGDDFLFKPIRPRHLVAAVQDRVRRLHAVEKPEPAST